MNLAINKKPILLVTLILTTLLLAPIKATLAETVLFISPSRVFLNDKEKTAVINVTNTSEVARSYKLSIENIIMTPEGVTSEVDNFDYSAKRMLRFVPRKFELQPGERQTVRVMARAPRDLADGQYHSHIHFLEDIVRTNKLNEAARQEKLAAGTGKMHIHFAYSAMIPIIVSHGSIETSIGIKDIKTRRMEETGHVEVSMSVTREGNGQGTAYIDTNYVGADNTESFVAKRQLANIYRELDERTMTYSFALPETSKTGGSINIKIYDSPEKDAEPIHEVTLPVPN